MAAKRGGGEAELTLEEFAEDLRYEGDPALEVEKKALQEAIRRYVNGLAPLDQSLFVLRYWYLEPTARIAQKLNMTETTVHVRLHRLRKRLGRFLEKEGWETI